MCRDATRDLEDPADLSALVASIEVDGKGLPTLLKEYLKLGARVLDFNVDEDFGNAVDGLIVIDLDTAESRLLRRYLGDEGLERFYAYRDSAFARFEHARFDGLQQLSGVDAAQVRGARQPIEARAPQAGGSAFEGHRVVQLQLGEEQ
jgi:hypothetical protein